MRRFSSATQLLTVSQGKLKRLPIQLVKRFSLVVRAARLRRRCTAGGRRRVWTNASFTVECAHQAEAP